MSSITINMSFLKNYLHISLHENLDDFFKILESLNHPICIWLLSHTQIPRKLQNHTQQLETLTNRLFILNGKASATDASYLMAHFPSFLSVHVLLSFLSFIYARVLLYPHYRSFPPHFVIKLASKVTYKQQMLSNKFCYLLKR